METICQFNPIRCNGTDCECHLKCKTLECRCGCVTYYDIGEVEVQCMGCPEIFKLNSPNQ